MLNTLSFINLYFSILVAVITGIASVVLVGYGEYSNAGLALMYAIVFTARAHISNQYIKSVESAQFRQWWVANRLKIRAGLDTKYTDRQAVSEHFTQFPH